MPPTGLINAKATAMTLASILMPNWVSWEVQSPGGKLTKTIGLHKSCSWLDSTCQDFPTEGECGDDEHGDPFCAMWRSVGFLMSAAAVFELVTLLAFVMLLIGGKQKREKGWRILALLLVWVGVLQCAAMAIVVCISMQSRGSWTDLV